MLSAGNKISKAVFLVQPFPLIIPMPPHFLAATNVGDGKNALCPVIVGVVTAQNRFLLEGVPGQPVHVQFDGGI